MLSAGVTPLTALALRSVLVGLRRRAGLGTVAAAGTLRSRGGPTPPPGCRHGLECLGRAHGPGRAVAAGVVVPPRVRRSPELSASSSPPVPSPTRIGRAVSLALAWLARRGSRRARMSPSRSRCASARCVRSSVRRRRVLLVCPPSRSRRTLPGVLRRSPQGSIRARPAPAWDAASPVLRSCARAVAWPRRRRPASTGAAPAGRAVCQLVDDRRPVKWRCRPGQPRPPAFASVAEAPTPRPPTSSETRSDQRPRLGPSRTPPR